MRRFWNFMLQASGLCLGLFAVVFMSVPSVSIWKTIAGVACAVLGTICLIAMYFAKSTRGGEEVHLVKRELEHYPPDSLTRTDLHNDHVD